mmetsp:Transcript_28921/g.69874  ORF Transcript_28921/g.69874 Transcript_28921/m.69874 type:complete len:81 (+) Transcript_28921:119-361(+)
MAKTGDEDWRVFAVMTFVDSFPQQLLCTKSECRSRQSSSSSSSNYMNEARNGNFPIHKQQVMKWIIGYVVEYVYDSKTRS